MQVWLAVYTEHECQLYRWVMRRVQEEHRVTVTIDIHTRVSQAMALYKKQLEEKVLPMHSKRQQTITDIEHILALITDARQCTSAVKAVVERMPEVRLWWGFRSRPSVLKKLLCDALQATEDADEIQHLKVTVSHLQQSLCEVKHMLHQSQQCHQDHITKLHQQYHDTVTTMRHAHQEEVHRMRQELSVMKHTIGMHLHHRLPIERKAEA